MPQFIQYIGEFIFLYPLLMSYIWMIGGLIFFFRHEHRKQSIPVLPRFPMFSILIPCHNEEGQIGDTIRQLLEIDYPKFEIIAVDDGSTDQTAQIINELARRHAPVRGVYLEENQGKAAALNFATLVCRGELVLTLDADALLSPQALHWIAWHFVNFPRVGAVTGNPRVINRTSLLAKIQIGEFATIIGLIKRTQRILGKVLTVSGVVAAFRKSALHSAGYWATDMVTEDIDITWKLEKYFWDVRYEPRATCWIYVPETIRGLWRQRMRWSQGGVEVLKKHAGIWRHWKQRRLWPVYLENVISILWSYSFWAMVLLWLITTVFDLSLGITTAPPLPPRWTGSVLALTSILQFAVSFYVDRHYEKRFGRYLFWVIWYPFIYWMISSLTVVCAAPRALLKKRGKRAVWRSPDRGLQKIFKKRTEHA